MFSVFLNLHTNLHCSKFVAFAAFAILALGCKSIANLIFYPAGVLRCQGWWNDSIDVLQMLECFNVFNISISRISVIVSSDLTYCLELKVDSRNVIMSFDDTIGIIRVFGLCPPIVSEFLSS